MCSLCVAKPCGYPNGMSGQIGYMYQIYLLQYEHSKESCQNDCPIVDHILYVSDILSFHPFLPFDFDIKSIVD